MRLPNLANLLVLIGLVVLLTTFWLPTWSGRRAARVEDRAFDVTIELLRAGVQHEPLDVSDPAALEAVLADLHSRCAALGQPESDLPTLAGQAPDGSPVLGNRHYLFRLVREPPPLRKPLDYDPRARRPLEVYGWPRTLLPPGTTVFYAPEWGRPASTRNLSARYNGLEQLPPPGAGRRRQSADDADSAKLHYRSMGDERWLIVPSASTWERR